MKIKNKTIRFLSSILLFPIISILNWSTMDQPKNFTEENLITEYFQKEQEKENTEKRVQESGTKSGINTNENTKQEKQPSTNKTTNKSNLQNNISSTSTAQASTNTGSGASQPTQTNDQSSTGQSNYEAEVVRLCNKARQEVGVSALLNQNSKLQKAADIRATEIKQTFSHTRPNGTTAYTVLGEVSISYTTWGENIAYGQKTPQEVVNAWMNSPGHKANILNATFKEIAVRMKDYYWVQIFI